MNPDMGVRLGTAALVEELAAVDPARRPQAAAALAPLLGEWVIRRFGFASLFGLCAALALVAAALAWGVRERRREVWQPVRGAEWARAGLEGLFRRHMAVTLFFGLSAGTIFVFVPTFAEHLKTCPTCSYDKVTQFLSMCGVGAVLRLGEAEDDDFPEATDG